ncbi:MAG: RHS repeat-associated core domain-containing protein [Pyrinomonadaceae bacterium]|nr:RHS repeat-associated core domain-containing protein [Pyrinomonadaceae bacterium]
MAYESVGVVENGAVSSRGDYTAFGEESITAERASGLGYTSSQDGVRKGYTGYEKDTESGLDFAQARYYNSVHGRFTSVDPLTASSSASQQPE